jgi:hypothetical protein
VTDVAPSLLLAFSALVIHMMAFTSVVAAFRTLPANWLERFWREAGYGSSRGWARWSNVALGGAFALLATWIGVNLLLAGSQLTLIGAAELLLASAWLLYLLVGARASRTG